MPSCTTSTPTQGQELRGPKNRASPQPKASCCCGSIKSSRCRTTITRTNVSICTSINCTNSADELRTCTTVVCNVTKAQATSPTGLGQHQLVCGCWVGASHSLLKNGNTDSRSRGGVSSAPNSLATLSQPGLCHSPTTANNSIHKANEIFVSKNGALRGSTRISCRETLPQDTESNLAWISSCATVAWVVVLTIAVFFSNTLCTTTSNSSCCIFILPDRHKGSTSGAGITPANNGILESGCKTAS
mmetsp:Transcript_8082/g.11304  ORF Transcript_8082/g.11304 Transcript_8082/m.11304 type:complete len:245 (+) Transcript_8082:53-787(+)